MKVHLICLTGICIPLNKPCNAKDDLDSNMLTSWSVLVPLTKCPWLSTAIIAVSLSASDSNQLTSVLRTLKITRKSFFFPFSLATGHCSVSLHLLTYEWCPSLSHTVTLKIFIDRVQIPLRELFSLHSSGSMFCILQTSFVTYLFWQKCSVLKKFFLGGVYFSYLLWVQNKKTNKKKRKKKWKNKNQVTPGDFCGSHSHHSVLHNFSHPHSYLYCCFFRKWHWLVSPHAPNSFVYILINPFCFPQMCHSLNALFIYGLSVILYFAKLQSYQNKFYCINILFHKANRTQCAFFLISGHHCKTACARTNLIICMLQ